MAWFRSIEEKAGVEAPGYEPPPDPLGDDEPDAESEEVRRADPLGLGLAVGGACLVVVALFLPMIETKGDFSRIAQNHLIQHNGWPLVITAVGILASAVGFQRGHRRYWGVIIGGLAALGFAIWLGLDKDNLKLAALNSNGDPIPGTTEAGNPGVGIYLAGLGGALAAVGGWFLESKSEMQSPAPPAAKQEHPPDDRAPTDSLAQELERLSQLRAADRLSEDEFKRAKARLLGAIDEEPPA